jgi:penicillin amidase
MTTPATQKLIAALGAGRTLADAAAAAGLSAAEAERLWEELTRARLPPATATLTAEVASPVEVIRDAYGVPHVYAASERDLFLGLGFAMAQDRLWLMDYLRRKATGRLSEIVGPRYVEQDYLYRVLDFPTICARNHARLGQRWRDLLDGMAAGVNRAIAQAGDALPVEFDLLGYRPEPWTAVDILVGLRYQWWGLSGRLAQITSATALDRALGDAVDAFTKPERDDLYIVPDGLNRASAEGQPAEVRDSLHLDRQPHGSNNWVIGGQRTRSGKPLLANDPHYSYAEAHGNFYPCHLVGAGHSEAGFVFLGTPGMMTGLNDRIAWGFTNNGATIRDLYAEQIDPADPSRYRRGGHWEPLTTRPVEILVKGEEPVRRTVRSTAHGPIVNEVVPKIGDDDPPLALRWVGFEMIDDVQALVEMNTATSWSQFRAALRNWACSVTNFIYGDVDGNIGYQMSARVPLRAVSTRAIRPAWHADHEWQGYIPFDGNPRLENPPDGIIATANQRPINPGYRWPIYGAYAGGTRQARILEVLRSKEDHDAADFRRMQFDSKQLIAEEVAPRIVAALRRGGHGDDAALGEVAAILNGWDLVARTDTVAQSIFEMFMERWTPAFAAATVADAATRRAAQAAPSDDATLRAAAGASARRALVGEEHPLDEARLDGLIVETMRGALAELAERFGADRAGWTWGAVHTYSWPHPLGRVGDLGRLLNGPKLPCEGTQNVINNVSPSHSEPFVASSGPTYRLIADLADTSAVLVNSHCPTSAHPASRHYADTIRDWAQGNYQVLRRRRELIEAEAEGKTTLHPG